MSMTALGRARAMADDKWPEVLNAMIRLPQSQFADLVDILALPGFPACFREDVRGLDRDQLELLWELAAVGLAEAHVRKMEASTQPMMTAMSRP